MIELIGFALLFAGIGAVGIAVALATAAVWVAVRNQLLKRRSPKPDTEA